MLTASAKPPDARVVTDHPVGNMNDFTKCHGPLSQNGWGCNSQDQSGALILL